ncbi:MAG TPA: hypothetical protein VG269_03820 [Tepidisphaeraceae bacterium]|jgi:TPR repeat protein|nr:hypothetical protein [Tepidisphaeraceae bacterium]
MTTRTRDLLQRKRLLRADLEEFREHFYRFGSRPSPQAAVRLIATARDSNDPELLFWAWDCLTEGLVPVNNLAGSDVLRRAAELNYPPAMAALGAELCKGGDAAENATVGLRLLKQACDKHDGLALRNMGAIFALGTKGLMPDMKKSVEYLDRSLDAGFLPAASVLEKLYRSIGDDAHADAYRKRAADFGDVNAMREIVVAQDSSVPADTALALHYARRLALYEDPQALRTLAIWTEAQKFGLIRDPALCRRLLTRAAREGDVVAKIAMGEGLLKNAAGFPKQPLRGLSQLERLAAGEDSSGHSAYLLGEALFTGEYLPQDKNRGLLLLQGSAAQGFAPAKKFLSDNGLALVGTTRPTTTVAGPPVAGTPTPADQLAIDDYEFYDWLYWFEDAPSQETQARMVSRARGIVPDARSQAWAAASAIRLNTQGVQPEEVRDWLLRSSDHGDTVGITFCAEEMLRPGGCLSHDAKKAVEMLQHASNLGEPLAKFALGAAFQSGEINGLERSLEKSMSWFRQIDAGEMCAQWSRLYAIYTEQGNDSKASGAALVGTIAGDPVSMNILARRLEMQYPEEGNAIDAIPPSDWDLVFLRGALWNNLPLVTAFASRLHGHDSPDANLSRTLLRRAASRGDREARAILAAALVTGEYGVNTDSDRGLAELEEIACVDDPPASDFGRNEAEWQLGRILCDGKNGLQDRQRGRMLIQRAAAQHHPQASLWQHNKSKIDSGADPALDNGNPELAKGNEFAKQKDYPQAILSWKLAAESGNPVAMYNLGVLYDHGIAVQRNSHEAISWYQKSAASGNSNAMLNIGILYVEGAGVPQDYKRGIEWYRQAAAAGNSGAMLNLGLLSQFGRGVPQEFKQAMAWYRRAAEGGSSAAMFNIGELYLHGQGVAPDYKQAMFWYQKAAAAGNPDGMLNIGMMYDNGLGVTQDYKQAAFWYQKAAALGSTKAMFNLGILFSFGRGQAKDEKQAMAWFRRAAEGGNLRAMCTVGWLYDNGKGVSQDYKQAMEWYLKSAGGGDAEAMNNIGVLYYNGRGVPADAAKAIDWFEKAVALGNTEAKATLKTLLPQTQPVR